VISVRIVAKFSFFTALRMAIKNPTLATIKRLCACSMNRCAFRDCNVPLVEKSGTFTGEICHIHAASELGPRFIESQSDEERHGYANLILLCGRHHALVDREYEKYRADVLCAMKREHEERGTVDISPEFVAAAQKLYSKYTHNLSIANSVKIMTASPGAIQADTVVVQTKRSRLVVAPNADSIGGDLRIRNYVYYLIQRYNEFMKADKTKTERRKYMAIYLAIQRHFGAKWELVPLARATTLIDFLHTRIDKTIVGKVNKARGIRSYHDLAEHPHK
jgi:hypothetical protein